MKLRTAIALAAACGIAAGAQLDAPVEAPVAVGEGEDKEPSVDELITRLGDESYAEREKASSALWQRGEGVLRSLRRALLSDDPEVAFRARELAEKIDLGILPDTPPMVLELVNSYDEVADRNKSTVLFQLRRMGAFRPMLKLFQREPDPGIRADLRRVIDDAAVIAARRQVVEGRLDSALEYLEMAPADAEGLAAWAAFHAACGTAPAELRRVRDMKGRIGALHRMALKRALGDIPGAREEAKVAGEREVAAGLSILLGDPLPWLELPPRDRFRTRFHETYRTWARQHWRTGEDEAEDIIDRMVRAVEEGDEDDQYTGLNALMLTGHHQIAAEQMAKFSPANTFVHYDSIEEVDQALRVIGIDPEQPDYKQWSGKMAARILKELDDSGSEQQQMIRLGAMLEARGKPEIAWNCMKPWVSGMMELEEDADELLLNVLHEWFTKGLIECTIRGLALWAGDDADKWEMGTEELLGLSGGNGTLWRRLASGEGGLKGEKQLRVYLALFGVSTNEEKQRQEWIDRLWNEAKKAKGEERETLLGIVVTVAREAGLRELALEALEMVTEGDSGHDRYSSYLVMLAVAGEWDKVAEGWRKALESNPARPSTQAFLAASLRRAGQEEEARDVEKLIEMLAMGDEATCLEIANAYSFGGDFKRAGEWQRRAVVEGDPKSESWPAVVEELKQTALEKGEWKAGAALCEVLALIGLERERVYQDTPLMRLRMRVEADFARAMSQLDDNRESALEMIDECYADLSSDGLIADYFLPGLRNAGLRKEHDRFFENTWQSFARVIEKFPESHNTLNTAAWISARAVRRLDEAELLQKRALAIRPNQAAYLDTMAELFFAKRNRAKALEWSAKAVSNEPSDVMLRRQYERFRGGKFPVR